MHSTHHRDGASSTRRPRFGADAAVRALFAATAFVAAALVFLVQPMAAKQLLPAFGGAPNVWNTAVVFFQLLLVAGYALSHASIRSLGPRRQVLFQLGIAALVFFFLPFALRGAAAPASGAPAALRLIVLLGVGVGVPYLAVTMASPALQRWYADLALPDSDDPYFLYVASNGGSLLGLLAFPFLIEPSLATGPQQTVWAVGYAVYVAGLVACGVILWRRGAAGDATAAPGVVAPGPAAPAPAAGPPVRAEAPGERAIDVPRGLAWVLVAAVPASLMLGVTSYITTDIASAPLLWTVPLALYLVSFMVTFGRRVRVGVRTAGLATALVVVLLTLVTLGTIQLAMPWRLALHLAAMFAAAVLAHAWLHEDRPPATQLTLFYLLLAIGGVIGGAFTALLAPALFDRVLEYPLLLAAVLVLRPGLWRPARPRRARVAELVLAGAVVAAVLVGPLRRLLFDVPEPSVPGALILGAALLLLAARRWGFAVAVAGVLAFTTLDMNRDPLFIARNFYGVLRVDERPPDLLQLRHGTTLHGQQFQARERRDLPTTYFSPVGPLGDLFELVQAGGTLFRDIGVVGLGAGTIAAYGAEGQRFTFYEIDPAVIRVALSPEYFRYLTRTRARFEIIEGDARLRLAEAPDDAYDLLILDAYSSDAIPVHLMTVEAFQLYLDKLRPGGIMALHISSRHLNLERVVAANAAVLGLPGAARNDPAGTRGHQALGATPSHWVMLARDADLLQPLVTEQRWRVLEPAPPRYRWTDDFSNIAGALVWWD